jgi:hypothetical protein
MEIVVWSIIIAGLLVQIIVGALTVAAGGIGIVLLVFSLIYLILMICNYKRIRTGIAICKVTDFSGHLQSLQKIKVVYLIS